MATDAERLEMIQKKDALEAMIKQLQPPLVADLLLLRLPAAPTSRTNPQAFQQVLDELQALFLKVKAQADQLKQEQTTALAEKDRRIQELEAKLQEAIKAGQDGITKMEQEAAGIYSKKIEELTADRDHYKQAAIEFGQELERRVDAETTG